MDFKTVFWQWLLWKRQHYENGYITARNHCIRREFDLADLQNLAIAKVRLETFDEVSNDLFGMLGFY